jgi:hypothetical protein
MDVMLGKNKVTLRDSMRGPLEMFFRMINGPDGIAWEEEFKRFIRKEQPWDIARAAAAKAELQRTIPAPLSIAVNADAIPFIPDGLNLDGKGAEHRGMGTVTLRKHEDDQLSINGRKVERYFSPNQKGSSAIKGYKLGKELQYEPTLNACILDALYVNQQLIPKSWDSGSTYFWATKFCDETGGVCVACLYRNGKQWCRRHRWLGGDWRNRERAARLAKLPSLA